MFQLMDTVTLEDNKKYLVTDKREYNKKLYYLLVNEDDVFDFLIGFIEGKDFNLVTDKNEYSKLLELFHKNSFEVEKEIEDIINN